MKKYQNNGVVASVPASTSPHYQNMQSQQLAQQPGAGMPSTVNNAVAAAVVPTIPASVTTASAAAAAAAAAASAVTPLASTTPVVSAHANTNDNLAKAAPDATPTASINPEAGQTNQYSHPQHRHNQRDENYATGFSYPRASMESIQSGKDMQKYVDFK